MIYSLLFHTRSIISIFFFLIFSLSANAQQGLRAEYYDGTNFDSLVAVRTEYKIDRSWNNIPPVEGIDPHECSIRWTGKLAPGVTGTYSFSARVDDGIRVWVDDQIIIDDWQLNDVGRFTGKVRLEANKEYDLKVEYFNALIEGEITLLWKIPPKKKKWYSHFFSGDYVVIAPEYFRQPKASTPTREVVAVDLATVPRKKEVVAQKVESPPAPTKRAKTVPEAKVIEVDPPVHIVEEVVAEIEVQAELNDQLVDQYIPKNINFEHAKTNILEDSFTELNLFAEFLLTHSDLTVKIEGHTDPVGNEEKNMELSERRAYSVARYLVKKGVDAKRIKAEGFGGSRPLVVPEDGDYHPANRRVEFLVSGLEDIAENN